jgi:hypothetical protein
MKTKDGTSGMSMIQSTSFYSREDEKTKFNWFSYELSIEVYDVIKQNVGHLLKRARISDEDLAAFSIFFSKNMQGVILEKLTGKIDTVYISPEMRTLYFPEINDKLVDRMVNAILKAWDELLSVCESCPNRCISEKGAYSPMFDDPFYSEIA